MAYVNELKPIGGEVYIQTYNWASIQLQISSRVGISIIRTPGSPSSRSHKKSTTTPSYSPLAEPPNGEKKSPTTEAERTHSLAPPREREIAGRSETKHRARARRVESSSGPWHCEPSTEVLTPLNSSLVVVTPSLGLSSLRICPTGPCSRSRAKVPHRLFLPPPWLSLYSRLVNDGCACVCVVRGVGVCVLGWLVFGCALRFVFGESTWVVVGFIVVRWYVRIVGMEL